MGTFFISVTDPTANLTVTSNTTIADADLTTIYNWIKYFSGNNAITPGNAMVVWSQAMLGWSLQQVQAWQLQVAIANVSVNTISTNTAVTGN